MRVSRAGAIAAVASLAVCGVCALGAVAAGRAAPPASSVDVTPSPGELALPATPPDLLVTASLASPDAAWTDVQKKLGAVGAFLPATFAGLVGSAVGVEEEVTARVDGSAPAYLAIEAGPRWALALPARDTARMAALLDDAARVPTRRRAASGDAGAGAADLVLYASTVHPDGVVLARVAAAPGFVVLASDETAARDLAPYAARALPRSPRLVAAVDAVRALLVDVSHDALAGPWRRLASTAWADARAGLAKQASVARERHGGRAADFADPEQVLRLADHASASLLAFLADLDHATLRLDPVDHAAAGETLVAAQLLLAPRSGGEVAEPWVRALAACELAPLAEEPLDAPVAALACSRAADRATFANGVSSAVRAALGERFAPGDADRGEKALADLARARGGGEAEWMTVAVTPGPSLRLDTKVADAPLAGQAVRALVDLAHAPGIAEPLAADLGIRVHPPGESSAVVERTRPLPPPLHADAGADGALSLVWRADAGRLTGAGGPSAPAALAARTTALSDDDGVAATIRALVRPPAASPSFALLLQPQLVSSLFPDARPHAAVGLAAGAGGSGGDSGTQAFVRVVADDSLVRSLVRLATGF